VTRSARAVALGVLVRVDDGAYSNLVLPGVLRDSGLSTRDRAFVTDLVYGTLRRRRTLDHLLDPVLDRPLDALDAPVRAALRLGVYQLVSDVPAHAAVGETVEVAPLRARPLTNAVLRKVAASGPPWSLPAGDDLGALGVRLSYPDWLVEYLIAVLGREDALATLATANEPAPVTLRPNRRRTTPDDLVRELEAGGATVAPGRLETGAIMVRGLGDPARVPAVAEGRATPQDEASLAVVAELDPGPADSVLDTCAAPGGKTTAAAERAGDSGRIVAADLHAGRLSLVERAAARLGLAIEPVVADGRALPVPGSTFDRVLVDAPCTGLGVLRRRPEARWRVRPEDAATLAALQRGLLREATRTVRPGGTLVYSVCTLTWDETVAIDEWTADELPELAAAEPPGPPWRPWGRGALLLPHDAGTDGMFVLRLHRASTSRR
jgi:16S rRNA (cytosine967-C5)-methyltransferase